MTTGRHWSSPKKGIVVLAAALLVLIGAPPASAVYYGGGMNSRSFCVQNPAVNSTWLTPINNGRNAWNNHASFPGTLTAYSGCTSYMSVGSYGGGWYGLYTPLITGSQFSIQLDSTNLNALVAANGYTFANVIKSTSAHELGHGLRLGDIPSGTPSSLMSYSRNRNVVTGPSTADVNESNGYY